MTPSSYYFHCLSTDVAWFHSVYPNASDFTRHAHDIKPQGTGGDRVTCCSQHATCIIQLLTPLPCPSPPSRSVRLRFFSPIKSGGWGQGEGVRGAAAGGLQGAAACMHRTCLCASSPAVFASPAAMQHAAACDARVCQGWAQALLTGYGHYRGVCCASAELHCVIVTMQPL